MDIDSQSNKISVLMSVYNDEKRVSKSIESILNQTFQDFEFLILDDCSTDNTYEICNYYAKKNQKIKLMKNHQNLGLTKSLNLLISESNYELIARQDSDDESFKQRLEIQLKIMEKQLKCLFHIFAKIFPFSYSLEHSELQQIKKLWNI